MKSVWLWILLILLPASLAAEVLDNPRLSGHLKTLNLYLDRTPIGTEEGLISTASFRLELNAALPAKLDFEIAVEQAALWSDPGDLAGLPQDSVNRVFAAEKSWSRGGRSETQLVLDRFSLRGEQGGVRWQLGRQAIGFGRISLFSPLDVIAPFPPDALDVDVRPGVDAIKLQHFFGVGGQLGMITVFGDQPRNNSYLLAFSENLGNLDLLLLTGSLRDRPLVGGGLAGELGPLGVKAEVIWYRGSRVGQPDGDRRDDFAIAAFELWHRFENDLVILAEYLYNGVGSNKPWQYQRVSASAPLSEGLSFLHARHYLLLGPSYELHPLVTASGLLIHNLQDNSSLLRPQLAISLSDNLQLDLFWAFTFGKKNRRDPLTGLPRQRSEFGAAGDSGGLLLRWYF